MDIDLAKAGLHMMIEKPISMRPVEEVERLAQVLVTFTQCMNMMPTICALLQSYLNCLHASGS